MCCSDDLCHEEIERGMSCTLEFFERRVSFARNSRTIIIRFNPEIIALFSLETKALEAKFTRIPVNRATD